MTDDALLPPLRNLLRELLFVEVAAGPRRGGSRGSISAAALAADEGVAGLGARLVRECVTHLHDSTHPHNTAESQVRESLHPLVPRCDYTGEVFYEGAKALWIAFDPATSLGAQSALTFFLDQAQTARVARVTGPGAPHPFVVHSDRVYYRFTAAFKGAEVDERGLPRTAWGFRFSASPMRGLQWLRESQVLRDPSLEWACWLLQFLLLEASGALDPAAVHNAEVFGALVRYLRARGTPFKHRVISLVQLMLRHPDRFPPHSRPALPPVLGIERAALEAYSRFKASGRVFLPRRVQRLLELGCLARRCARWFDPDPALFRRPLPLRVRRTTGLFQRVLTLEPRLEASTPPQQSLMGTQEVLLDVADAAECILLGARLPDHLVCAAYADLSGSPLSKPRRSAAERALIDCGEWGAEADAQLVAWLNDTVQRGEVSALHLSPAHAALSDRDRFKYPLLADKQPAALRMRLALLKVFNLRVEGVLDALDLASRSPASLGSQLRALGHCVFLDTKRHLLQQAIEATTAAGATRVAIRLDNRRAFESMDRNLTGLRSSQCLFAQAFRALRRCTPAQFRAPLDDKGRLFVVKFSGEEGVDWGGLYREAVLRMVEDLFSSRFSLFIPSPNGAHQLRRRCRTSRACSHTRARARAGTHGIGMYGDKFVPNPSQTSSLAMEVRVALPCAPAPSPVLHADSRSDADV